MPDYVITQGDTQPILTDTLKLSNGELVDLTGATVKVLVRNPTASEVQTLTGVVKVEGNPKAGEIAYYPTAVDTASAGNFMGSWHVVFPGGGTMTFPTEGYMWFQVQPNLEKLPALMVGLDEIKSELNIEPDDRTHDTKLLRYLKAAQSLVENLTGPIIPRRYDEWYEGGHSTISLRHQPSYGYGTTPIFMVMAVSEYRGPIEYTLSLVPTPTQGSVYSTMAHGELGTIVRRTSGGGTYSFWEDPAHPEQSVHVVYYVGQEEVPENVAEAVIETISWWYYTRQQVGKGRQRQADFETEGRPLVALPYHAEAMLAPTRRPPVCA